MKLDGILKKLKTAKFKEIISKIFLGRSKFFILLLAFLLLAYCEYSWYFYFYNSSWNNDKKQEYAKTKSDRTVFFNEEKFQKIVNKIEERKNKYQNTLEVTRDIFNLK